MECATLNKIVKIIVLFIVMSASSCGILSNLDFDLRGNEYDTSDAVKKAMKTRPLPDSRGIISYPTYEVAVARQGDTIKSISDRLGLVSKKVARYNGMSALEKLNEGQLISLPNRTIGIKKQQNISTSNGNEVKLIDKENNEYLFDEFKLYVIKKEFAGKDLSYEMKSLNSEKPRIKGLSIISDNKVSKVYKGTYTTCAKRKGCSPWIIQAEEVTHNKKDKLIDYKNAWLKIYDVPIMYFPRFFHPDPTVKRQSGFLAPTFSDSSSAGLSVTVPYFYAISVDKDLTFKPRIFGNNSAIIQNEYRKAGKNSFLTSDFGSFVDNKGSKSHFFINTIFEDISDYFEESSLTVKIENTSNDTYLSKYNISSPIIKDRNLLTSLIDYKGSNDNLNINIYSKVYENLNEKILIGMNLFYLTYL